jgi:hypothetical protein
MLTRCVVLLFGITFVLAGVLGLVPAATTPPPPNAPHLHVEVAYGYLLGLFPVNLVHSLIHLTLGLLGLAAWRNVQSARVYARGLAVFLGLLAVMGFMPAFSTTFGLIPLFGHDIWLHALEALAAACVGFAIRAEPRLVGAPRRLA